MNRVEVDSLRAVEVQTISINEAIQIIGKVLFDNIGKNRLIDHFRPIFVGYQIMLIN